MTHMVTRCPKCATAFRVTTTQLESARGSVRCGSCLHIFKAHDDLVSTAPVTKQGAVTQPEIEKAAATPSIQIAEPTVKAFNLGESQSATAKTKIDIDYPDDMLISDDMDEPSIDNSSYEFEGYVDIDLRPKQSTSLFERKIEIESEKESDEVDESWAEQLLEEDQELYSALHNNQARGQAIPAHTAKQPLSQDLSSAIMERHDIEIPDVSEYARINEEFSNLYSTPDIVEETPQQASKPIAAEIPLTATSREPQDLQPNATTTFGSGFFRHRDDQNLLQMQKHPLKSQPAIHAGQDSRATLLKNIAPSPIELTAQRILNWSQKTHWGPLTLLAGVILILQIGYFKFDSLSLVEPYRTAYSWACPIFKCKLTDTSKIIAYQLILRKHPSAANALLLDVMIRNDAAFEQRFPDLTLVFTTLDDKPVASRRFKAKEYLSGELAGREMIPSKQPVHVTLELSDPGPEAVNYHMSIAP